MGGSVVFFVGGDGRCLFEEDSKKRLAVEAVVAGARGLSNKLSG